MTNDYTVNLWYTKGKGTTFYLTIEYLIYGRGISNQDILKNPTKVLQCTIQELHVS